MNQPNIPDQPDQSIQPMNTNTNSGVPEQIKMKIAELQETILTAHPRMPLLLREIHKILLADPDVVTLMDEESIGIIVSGLKKQTAIEISTAALKSKSSKAVLSKTTVDDL